VSIDYFQGSRDKFTVYLYQIEGDFYKLNSRKCTYGEESNPLTLLIALGATVMKPLTVGSSFVRKETFIGTQRWRNLNPETAEEAWLASED
jgi:hypothetical protein